MFWIGLVIIVFTYLGYGLLCAVLLKLRGGYPVPETPAPDNWPAVTLLIAAYNEEDILPEKVANCRALTYPSSQLTLLFVTDGSTDGSADYLRQQTDIRLLHRDERQGKIAAVARAMDQVETPLTVLTDANTFLNPEALQLLVRHFQDPKVGAVAGEKQVISAGDASSGGEGLYWRYESFLKRQDSALYSVVGAAGELYAVRTELFQDVPSDTILDDFMQTLGIAQMGYRVTYEPEATAREYASANVKEELKRKVRISAGGFQAMRRLLPLLNPLRHGLLSFQYIGHRVLRWTLAPLFLPIVFFTNIILAMDGGYVYPLLLVGQVLFYGLVLLGYLFRTRKIPVPGFFAPYYFFIMNYSVYAGFKRFLFNQQKASWEKAKRAEGGEAKVAQSVP